ncbi:hypothetical protein SLE2022_069450 [Rubroshorea leprosula]
MAILPSPTSSPQLTTPFRSPSPRTLSREPKSLLCFRTRATDPQSSSTSEQEPAKPESSADEDPFDTRLSQVRLRYRTGSGKKAEKRKSKKTGSTSGPGSSMYLPPVPLKEPISGGLKVEFGFSPYSERINGRIAILGLTALLLVELATGKSLINYHTPAIVLIQVYFVTAVTALYVKYEKEKVSVWPDSSPKN